MNKTQTWTAVLEILNSHDLEESILTNLQEDLSKILAPKVGGGHSAHPPILDKDGNVTEAWCRYHETYEPIENIVVNKDGKSKGYCKAAASISNKRRKEAQSLKLEALAIMGDDIEKAQSLVKKASTIESTINDPEYYDLELDWEKFNSK